MLLVDDGSSDASTALAKDFAQKFANKVRYLAHPGHVNIGGCASRNLGVQSANGQLLAFLDADDRWIPTKLREQVEIMNSFPEVDVVCGTARYWSSWEGGEDRMVPSGHAHDRPIPPPEAILEVFPLGRAVSPCPSDLMIRRSALEAVGGFEELFVGPLFLYEDQALLTKLYLQHTIYFSKKHWLDYRIHDRSCMAEAKRTNSKHQVRRHFLKWLERYLEAGPHNDDRRIRRALDKALFPYRYPTAWFLFDKAKRGARRMFSLLAAGSTKLFSKPHHSRGAQC